MLLSSTIPPALADGFGNYPVPENDDWVISTDTTVWNETLMVNGDVIVQSGAVLSLAMVTLFINSTTDGQYGIHVQSGGALIANDTIISPLNGSYRMTFESNGDLYLNNATVIYLWGSGTAGGLRILNDDASLTNVTLLDSGGPGLYVTGACPYISGLTIINSTYGVYYANSTSGGKTITTFGDGDSTSEISFPSGGGANQDTMILMPRGSVIKSASMNLDCDVGEWIAYRNDTATSDFQTGTADNINISDGEIKLAGAQTDWAQAGPDFENGTQIDELSTDQSSGNLELSKTFTRKHSGKLFFDDFQDEDSNGWTEFAGDWEVSNGEYQASAQGDARSGIDGINVTNATLETKFKFLISGSGEWVGAHTRMADPEDTYTESGYMGYITWDGRASIYKAGSGDLVTTNISYNAFAFNTLKFKVKGPKLELYFNGLLILNAIDNAYSLGSTSLYAGNDREQSYEIASFDDVRIYTLGPFFTDQFNAGADAWTQVSGTWQVENGELSGNCTSGNITGIHAGEPSWRNYTTSVSVMDLDASDAGHWRSGLVLRYDENNSIWFFVCEDPDGFYVFKQVDGNYTQLWVGSHSVSSDTWYDLKIEVYDSNYYFYVSGGGFAGDTLLTSLKIDEDELNTGMVELTNWADGNASHAHFDNVRIFPTTRVFKDDFLGDSLDTTKWSPGQEEIDVSGGWVYLVQDNGNEAPVFESVENPFPTTGSFCIEGRVEFTQSTSSGTGIVTKAGGSGGTTILSIWADSAQLLDVTLCGNLVVDGQSTQMGTHAFRLSWDGSAYALSWDDVQVGMVNHNQRQDFIIIGNTAQGGPDWTDFKVDYISISHEQIISVIGLQEDYTVELVDSSNDEVKSTATVGPGGTTVNLEVSSLLFPFDGYFRVFSDLDVLLSSDSYSDIWAGDIYRFSNAKAWDDFDDGQMDGWTTAGGTWALEDGEISASSPYEDMQAYPGPVSIKDGEVEVKIRFPDAMNDEWAGIHVRKTEPSDSYMSSGYLASLRRDGYLSIYKAYSGDIANKMLSVTPQSFNSVRFSFVGANLKVYLNGTLQLETNDSTFAQGYVGLWSGNTVTPHSHFDDFKAVAMGTFISSIFDGGNEDQFIVSAEKTSYGPDGASISLEIRSSDDSEMNNPSEWLPTDWGYINQMEVMRYVQFRLTFRAPISGLLTNFGLSNMTLKFAQYDSIDGTFISDDIPASRVFKATASWNCDLNGQTLNVFLTNDGGSSWHQVSNGVEYAFETVCEPLKYKVEMSAASLSLTPILYDISVLGTMRKYPTNPALDVGADGDNEWSYSGELRNDVSLDDSNTTPDFSDELQDVIQDNLYEGPETVSAPLKISSSSETNMTLSSLAVVYAPPMNKVTVINATSEAFHFENCDLSLINCTALDSPVGINATASHVSLVDCTLLDINTSSIKLSGASSATTYDSLFDRTLLSIADTSSITVKWGLDLHVQNQDHSPAPGKQVTINDWSNTQVFQDPTDEYGSIGTLALTEFSSTASQRTYQTPHRVEISGSTANNIFHLTAEAHKSLSVFWDGDSDNDSVRDIDEGSQYIWTFEAEARAYQSSQLSSDSMAVGNGSVSQGTKGDIIDEDIAMVHAGDYKIYIRARQSISNTTESVNISVSSGQTTLIPTTTMALTNNTIYNWYPTNEFNITADSILHVNVSDANQTGNCVLLDRILLHQTVPGCFSDPLQNDSDGDGLTDGRNITAGVNIVSVGELNISTEPMDADTDHDFISDGNEYNGFFPEDRIETEDLDTTTINQSVNLKQFSILWRVNEQCTISNFSINLTITDDQVYRIKLGGTADVRLQGIYWHYAMVDPIPNRALEEAVRQAIEFNLTNTTSIISPINNHNESYLDNATKDKEMGGEDYPAILRWWVHQYDYNLTAGIYRMNLKLNLSRIYSIYHSICALGNIRLFEIWSDFIDIEQFRLDPLSDDTDSDTVIDGLDAVPFNPDADDDGLSDAREVQNGTDSLSRDSDRDGLRDRVELSGQNNNNDPYTSWDSDPSNIDLDPNTGTSPTDWDSDDDMLPDGWRDGYSIVHFPGQDWQPMNTSDTAGNMVKERIEGEDLGCDGVITADGPVCGDTNPGLTDSDNDSMLDYFESYWYSQGVPFITYSDDSNYDYDNDSLTNAGEFALDTHPGFNNTDSFQANENDWLLDGQEGRVIFRTNIENGSKEFGGYGAIQNASGYEWVYYVNSTEAAQEYGYNFSYINHTADFGGNSDWTITVARLWDGTLISYNRSEQKLYVWQPGADTNDSDGNGTLEGLVWVYYTGSSQSAATVSTTPQVAFRNSELYISDPFRADTEGDGVLDGIEGYNGVTIARWDEDTDRDGYRNVRDEDSDGDGIYDRVEVLLTTFNNNTIYDADNDTVANMLDLDSDADGLSDTTENWLNDTDADGFRNFIDWDADGDGLPDGWIQGNVFGAVWNSSQSAFVREWISIGNGDSAKDKNECEDFDFDGILDPGETNASDADTDGDILTDGYNWTDHAGNPISGELSAGTNQTLNDTDADTIWDGREVNGWNITVNFGTGNGEWVSVRTNSSPLRNDTDSDGLPDKEEHLFTNASNPDTDGDGRHDNYEDSNLNGSKESSETNPLDADTDGDYITDFNESGNTAYPFTGTYSDPLIGDTDGDGLYDGNEDSYGNGVYNGVIGTNEPNPRDKDSDDDGLNDYQESSIIFDMGYYSGENETDGDGLWNIVDPDSDGDHIPDGAEIRWDINSDNDTFTSGKAKPNVFDSDSDGDNVTDCWVDSDADGIYDDNEGEINVSWRTNATDIDSDGKNDYGHGEWIMVNTNKTKTELLTYFSSPEPYNSTYEGYDCSADTITLTHEDYPVIYNSSVVSSWVYIKTDTNSFYRYCSFEPPGGLNRSNLPLLPYTISNQERWGGTNPVSDDTDLDGIKDGPEGNYNTSSTDADSDDDGIKDGLETSYNGYLNITNATQQDSDGDGIQDGTEQAYTRGIEGTSVSIGNYYSTIQGTDLSKFVADSDPLTRTKANIIDTDIDGLPDGWIDGWSYDYFARDWGVFNETDGYFQVWEGEENPSVSANGKLWGNGKVDAGETSPLLNDTDGDGMPDGWERWFGLDPFNASDAVDDPDRDGLTNLEEYVCGTVPKQFQYHFSGYPWDSDGDQMPDGWEVYYGFNATNGSDWSLDADNDGLNNRNEYLVNRTGWYETDDGVWWNGSDPRCNDTDGDGRLDGTEGISSDYDGDLIPNVLDEDDDNDGIDTIDELEGWNITYILANDTEVEVFVRSNPLSIDSDFDGLGDFIEWNASMNASFADSDMDGYGDYIEYTNDSYDPLEVERNRPWSTDIPGIHVVEELDNSGLIPSLKRCYVHIEISVYDDVGLDRVTIRVFGGLGDLLGLNGKSNTTYLGGSKTGYVSVDMDIDYAFQRLNEFKVEAKVVDVNNNTFSTINVGGLKKETVDFFANVVFQFCPEFMGGIFGFFSSFLQNMYDDTIGMITQLPQMWEGITKIGDLIGKVSIDQMIAGMIQELTNKAKLVNPFSIVNQATKYQQFINGYISGAIIGTIMYQVLSIVLNPGSALAGAVAKVGKALTAVTAVAGLAAKVGSVVNSAKGVAKSITRVVKSIGVSLGKASDKILIKARSVVQDIYYYIDCKVLSRKLGKEITEIVAKSQMKSSKELSIGMWKYMKKGGGKKAVEDMMKEFGEEATEAALKKVGKSTLTWQKQQVERLAFIIKNPPPGGDKVIKNLDPLINNKGIQPMVDALWGGFDHNGKKVWMDTHKGVVAELQVAAEKIGPENVIELRPMKDGVEKADILCKNPNRAIQVKNRNSINDCVNGLQKDFSTSKKYYPSYQLEGYVPEHCVSDVQIKINALFPNDSIEIFAIPI